MENIELNGKILKPRELTVREMEKMLASLEEKKTDSIERLFPESPVPALALALSLDVEPDDLLDLAPSEIEVLIAAFEKSNPVFVVEMKRLAIISLRLMEASWKGSAEPSVN